jgi:hypothetical protein
VLDLFILISTGFAGAVITFYFNEGLKQGPVRSSAMLSLCAAFFPLYRSGYLFKQKHPLNIHRTLFHWYGFKSISIQLLVSLILSRFGLFYITRYRFLHLVEQKEKASRAAKITKCTKIL